MNYSTLCPPGFVSNAVQRHLLSLDPSSCLISCYENPYYKSMELCRRRLIRLYYSAVILYLCLRFFSYLLQLVIIQNKEALLISIFNWPFKSTQAFKNIIVA